MLDEQAKAASAAAVAARQQQRETTSSYRGVGWDQSKGKWIAQIKHEGRNQRLGRFLLVY